MKKLGMGVLWLGRYWSSPGPSRYSDSPSFTTLLHVHLRSRADGNSSSTLVVVVVVTWEWCRSRVKVQLTSRQNPIDCLEKRRHLETHLLEACSGDFLRGLGHPFVPGRHHALQERTLHMKHPDVHRPPPPKGAKDRSNKTRPLTKASLLKYRQQ